MKKFLYPRVSVHYHEIPIHPSVFSTITTNVSIVEHLIFRFKYRMRLVIYTRTNFFYITLWVEIFWWSMGILDTSLINKDTVSSEARIFCNVDNGIVALSPKNDNPNISDFFLIMAKLFLLLCSWITSSSSLDIILLFGGICLGNSPCQLHYLLKIWFLGNIKGKTLKNNKISYWNSKTSPVVINWLLRISINTKNKWTI